MEEKADIKTENVEVETKFCEENDDRDDHFDNQQRENVIDSPEIQPDELQVKANFEDKDGVTFKPENADDINFLLPSEDSKVEESFSGKALILEVNLNNESIEDTDLDTVFVKQEHSQTGTKRPASPSFGFPQSKRPTDGEESSLTFADLSFLDEDPVTSSAVSAVVKGEPESKIPEYLDVYSSIFAEDSSLKSCDQRESTQDAELLSTTPSYYETQFDYSSHTELANHAELATIDHNIPYVPGINSNFTDNNTHQSFSPELWNEVQPSSCSTPLSYSNLYPHENGNEQFQNEVFRGTHQFSDMELFNREMNGTEPCDLLGDFHSFPNHQQPAHPSAQQYYNYAASQSTPNDCNLQQPNFFNSCQNTNMSQVHNFDYFTPAPSNQQHLLQELCRQSFSNPTSNPINLNSDVQSSPECRNDCSHQYHPTYSTNRPIQTPHSNNDARDSTGNDDDVIVISSSPGTPESGSSIQSIAQHDSKVTNFQLVSYRPNSDIPRLQDYAHSIAVELLSHDLWKKFHEIGTEMIITKAGRRMFPTLKINISGLIPTKKYIMAIDVLPLDNKRYRYIYSSSHWMAAGNVTNEVPKRTYIHPDSPATGECWMRQTVVFDKMKLTNNEGNMKGHIILHSMHKYQPRIHLIECEGDGLRECETIRLTQCVDPSRDNLVMFVFPETQFTTVTAYQNQQITKLKIDKNPFAKGFRDASRSTKTQLRTTSNDETCQMYCQSPPVVTVCRTRGNEVTSTTQLHQMDPRYHEVDMKNYNAEPQTNDLSNFFSVGFTIEMKLQIQFQNFIIFPVDGTSI